MAQPVPVTVSEALNLVETAGVVQEAIKLGTCSLQSDKYICVCQGGELVVVDMSSGNAVKRWAKSAEAAIMNPVSKILALRVQGQLQICNLEQKNIMKTGTISEPIVFWRWITPVAIALVTAFAVYHWSVEGNSGPQKMFNRDAKLEGCEVTDYSISADGKWCLTTGNFQPSPEVIEGTMQLYSVEECASKILDGHIGTFAKIKLLGRVEEVQVLCFEKKTTSVAELHVVEVGKDKDAPGVFRLSTPQFPAPADVRGDFPIAMQVSHKYDMVFVITKMGHVAMFDIFSGKAIYRAKISDQVFVTASQESTGGFLGITARSGAVLQMAVNEATLVPYVLNTLRDNQLASQLASRLNLPVADELCISEFDRLLASNDVAGAATLAGESPDGLLRNASTIQRFQQIPTVPGSPSPLVQYFSVLVERGTLTKMESMEIAQWQLNQGDKHILEAWLTEDKLECTEDLGDLIAEFDSNMALSVYLRANAIEKVKSFLMKVKLANPRPLILISGRYNFIEEVTGYLYKNNMHTDIQMYIQASPQKTPTVVGKLLELHCPQGFIGKLLNSVEGQFPVDQLVEQLNRKQMKLLQPCLEAMVSTGNTQTATHNAIGKIYVTLKKDPATFLKKNEFFDPKVLGKYCEDRNPRMAVEAYANGEGLEDEVMRVAMDHHLHKDLAIFLIERQDPNLWGKVLAKREEAANEPAPRHHRIDKVVQMALKIMFKYHLFEDAFMVYSIWGDMKAERQKTAMYVKALKVLAENMKELERAASFADSVDDKAVWRELGNVQRREGLELEAVASFLKADEPGFSFEWRRRTGVRGMRNLGNTCFMNAACQGLASLPPFAQLFPVPREPERERSSRPSKGPGRLVDVTKDVTAKILKPKNGVRKAFAPRKLVANLKNFGLVDEDYEPWHHEDSHDFLHRLLEKLGESSLAMGHLFGGDMDCKVTCNECKCSSVRQEAFLDLSLEIPDGVNNVDEALRHFSMAETLAGDNMWMCPQCNGKKEAKRSIHITKAPTALVLNLKRFKFDGSKLSRNISFEKTLDVPVTGPEGCATFDLTGVVRHIELKPKNGIRATGHLMKGHYVAYAKNSKGKWFMANDEEVTEVKEKDVLESEAYILFYTRRARSWIRRMWEACVPSGSWA